MLCLNATELELKHGVELQTKRRTIQRARRRRSNRKSLTSSELKLKSMGTSVPLFEIWRFSQAAREFATPRHVQWPRANAGTESNSGRVA